MEFWDRQMPVGMRLRSSWDASHIADPAGELTLNHFEEVRGTSIARPIPIADFLAYARWFQRQVAPDLDERRVLAITRASDGFRLQIDDGEEISTPRVVVAAGIGSFARRPPVFDRVAPSLAPHSSEIHDLEPFAGRRVAVVGGGQSALETGALAKEAGAEVEVIVRRPRVRWLNRSGVIYRNLGPLRKLLYPPTDVGPPLLNQLVARPDLFRQVPERFQPTLAYRAIRPAVSDWLRPRLRDVRLTTGQWVVAVEPKGEQLILRLSDGSDRTVDCAVVATGYQVDVACYAFLGADLLGSIKVASGYPVLSRGFESSVPGLHILGAPAAHSFGPLMRFVSGTGYTGRMLARYIGGYSQSRPTERQHAVPPRRFVPG
jgi:thioredoxin reductase